MFELYVFVHTYIRSTNIERDFQKSNSRNLFSSFSDACLLHTPHNQPGLMPITTPSQAETDRPIQAPPFRETPAFQACYAPSRLREDSDSTRQSIRFRKFPPPKKRETHAQSGKQKQDRRPGKKSLGRICSYILIIETHNRGNINIRQKRKPANRSTGGWSLVSRHPHDDKQQQAFDARRHAPSSISPGFERSKSHQQTNLHDPTDRSSDHHSWSPSRAETDVEPPPTDAQRPDNPCPNQTGKPPAAPIDPTRRKPTISETKV